MLIYLASCNYSGRKPHPFANTEFITKIRVEVCLRLDKGPSVATMTAGAYGFLIIYRPELNDSNENQPLE